jgi:hypothetical protein
VWGHEGQVSYRIVTLGVGRRARSGGDDWRSAGGLEETAIDRSEREEGAEDDVVCADDLYAEELLVDGGVLADRGRRHQDAMLGVGAAPARGIEVSDAGRWGRVPAHMVEQLVEGGQTCAAPDEHGQEEDCVQAVSDGPAHGPRVYPNGLELVYSRQRAAGPTDAKLPGAADLGWSSRVLD